MTMNATTGRRTWQFCLRAAIDVCGKPSRMLVGVVLAAADVVIERRRYAERFPRSGTRVEQSRVSAPAARLIRGGVHDQILGAHRARRYNSSSGIDRRLCSQVRDDVRHRGPMASSAVSRSAR
jgi:hypothetical protein